MPLPPTETPDFEAIFNCLPSGAMVVTLDMTIVAANDAQLEASLKKRSEVIGRKFFDVYPRHAHQTNSDPQKEMEDSLARVLLYRQPDRMPIVRYDVPRREEDGGGLEERYWMATNKPLFDRNGEIRWFLLYIENVTGIVVLDRANAENERITLAQKKVIEELQNRNAELYESQASLRASQARFKAAVESVSDILWTTGPDGFMNSLQPAWGDFTGQTYEQYCGHGASDAVHPDDLQETMQAWATSIESGRPFAVEHRIRRRDGAWRLFSVRARPVFDENGVLREWVGVHTDITEARRAEENRKLLLDELNHRVKNSLATVQSISMQTLWSAPSPADFNREFNKRLLALSLAHNLLTHSDWQGASLLDVVKQEVAPYQDDDAPRIKMHGVDVYLAPKETLALSMALHELAANAAKYGTLSSDDGQVTIEWMTSPGSPTRLRLTWIESEGPRVEAPTRRGFGSRLIERGLAHELGGEASLDFKPSGVECVIEFPLRERC